MTPRKIQRYIKQKQKNTKRTVPTTKQVQVEQSFERVRTFERDNSKAKSINAKTMEFIALDNQPFSVVNDVDFRRLVEHLTSSPGTHYQVGAIFQMLPFRSYTVLLKRTSLSYLLWASLLLASRLTDIWTSDVSPMSMLSLTAQGVDDDFAQRKAVLHSQECAGSHTAAAISKAFENMFET